MYCKKCGTELRNEDNGICPNCHNQTIDKDKLKFLPSFILGLIASLFGISGGFCMSVCSSLYSSGISAFVLILGGSVLGLVGACQCLKNVRLGSVLQLIAAVMITICAYENRRRFSNNNSNAVILHQRYHRYVLLFY